MNNLYMLTDLTGRNAQSERTAVVWRWEVRRKALILVMAGTVCGLIPQLFLFVLIGPWGLLLVPIMIGIFFFIFESRRKDGLQLRQWEAIRDRLQDRNRGKIMLCGQPLESTSTWWHISSSSKPVAGFDPDPDADQDQESFDFDQIVGGQPA